MKKRTLIIFLIFFMIFLNWPVLSAESKKKPLRSVNISIGGPAYPHDADSLHTEYKKIKLDGMQSIDKNNGTLGIYIEYYPFSVMGFEGGAFFGSGPYIEMEPDECKQEFANEEKRCWTDSETYVTSYFSSGNYLGLSTRPYSFMLNENLYILPYLAFGWHRITYSYTPELEKIMGESLPSSIGNQVYYRVSLEIHHLGILETVGLFFRIGVEYKDMDATFPGLTEPIVRENWSITTNLGFSFW